MKTKEEIWWKHQTGLHPLNDIKAAAYPAMDEYAKEVAIDFNKWRNDNRWFNFSDGKWDYTHEYGTAGISKASREKNYRKTDDELFDLYQQEKSSLK